MRPPLVQLPTVAWDRRGGRSPPAFRPFPHRLGFPRSAPPAPAAAAIAPPGRAAPPPVPRRSAARRVPHGLGQPDHPPPLPFAVYPPQTRISHPPLTADANDSRRTTRTNTHNTIPQ